MRSQTCLWAGNQKYLAKKNFQEDADARLRNSEALGSFSRFGGLGFSLRSQLFGRLGESSICNNRYDRYDRYDGSGNAYAYAYAYAYPSSS